MEWQPIETAPKDGTPVLAWGPDWDRPRWARHPTAQEPYLGSVWVDVEDQSDPGFIYFEDPPTHWLPLPPVPAGTEG